MTPDALWPAITIALLRTADVTLNVFKTVAVVQGRRVVAPALQALESTAWLAAAALIFSNITPQRAVGYLVGVTVGTIVGMGIVKRLRLGMVTVRIYDPGVVTDTGTKLFSGVPQAIRERGFAATTFTGEGLDGDVQMTLLTVRRREAQAIMDTARAIAPGVFVSIDNDTIRAGESAAA